jgi:hypothetical protein
MTFNVLPRGFSSGSSSFRSSSPSRSAPSRSAPRQVVKPVQSRDVKKPSTFKKQETVVKPKSVATNKIDKKKSKAMASRNKEASKKYGTKANAEKAYREKLLSSNKYNSSTPPSKRPDHIPQSITINNNSVNTSYGMFPGGGYGYGYYDPISNMFTTLAIHQMIVNDARMMEAGYGHWGNNGRPIRAYSCFSIIIVSIVIVIVLCVTLCFIL